jgi:hypothetical protein
MQHILRADIIDAAEIVLQVSGFALEVISKLMREGHDRAVLPYNARQAEMAEPIGKALGVRVEFALESA